MTQHNDDNINNERLGDAPTQSNCTDLINQAISTLQEALTACTCPVTCDCSGQFITCLANASVFLFDNPTPTTGSVTLQATICNQCDPINSSLLFSFIEDNQPGPITFESEAITRVCCTAATIMSVTGSGTLSIDGFLIPADYIFAFGSIAGQCFFGFRVGPADHPVLKIEEFVSCDSIISITPCTSSSTTPTSMGSMSIPNPEVLGVNGAIPPNQLKSQSESFISNQDTDDGEINIGPKGVEPCAPCSDKNRNKGIPFQLMGCQCPEGTDPSPICNITFPPSGCAGYTGAEAVLTYFPPGSSGMAGKTGSGRVIECTNIVCGGTCEDCNVTLDIIQENGTLRFKADHFCSEPNIPCTIGIFTFATANQLIIGRNSYPGCFIYEPQYTEGIFACQECTECCSQFSLSYGPTNTAPFGTLFILSNFFCIPCPIVSPCPTDTSGTANHT